MENKAVKLYWEMIQMKETLYVETGLRIQKMRVKRGYTRDTVAELSGISTKFLYEIETGKKGFSASVLFRISKVLDVNCDYLLTGKRGKGNHSQKLLGALELFDEEQIHKLVQLLEIVYEIGT